MRLLRVSFSTLERMDFGEKVVLTIIVLAVIFAVVCAAIAVSDLVGLFVG